jgi:UDP-glucose 4-epimerase
MIWQLTYNEKKIVTNGGLSYVGTELCNIYSDFSWEDKNIIIDNKFISKWDSQLRKWNIEFIHGDILDKKLINKYFNDNDIIHYLSNIIDVQRAKK